MASKQVRAVALSNELWVACDPVRHMAEDRAARRAAAFRPFAPTRLQARLASAPPLYTTYQNQ